MDLNQYSFETDIKVIENDDVKLEILFDKVLTEKDYWYVERIILFALFQSWIELSVFGGFTETIDILHKNSVKVPKRKFNTIIIAFKLKSTQVNALKNLFHIFEHGWNQNPRYAGIAKIVKMTISEIDCYFMDYEYEY